MALTKAQTDEKFYFTKLLGLNKVWHPYVGATNIKQSLKNNSGLL